MELSPRLYHWLVRPKFLTDLYINNVLKLNFDFTNKIVLDFGCGTGSTSSIFIPSNYLGVDPDSRRVAYAKRLHPNHNFNVLKGSRLPISDNSIDYILIIAVLHHISSDDIQAYLQDFPRILKPYGKIVVIEPCLFKHSYLSNWFMNFFDKGKYIRDEESYLEMFKINNFRTEVIKRYKKLFYNEIFFSASLS